MNRSVPRLFSATCVVLLSAIGWGPKVAHASEEVCAEWKKFAEETQNPRDKQWAEALCMPDALALDKAWTEARGYNATTIIAKAREQGKVPAELKPGLTITAENVDTIKGLKELLPDYYYQRLKSKDWLPFQEIRVVPTSHIYLSKGRLEGVKREKGEFFTDERGGLHVKNCTTCPAGSDDWGLRTQGLPFFPKPKSGLEGFWLFMAHDIGVDQLFFKPNDFLLCGSSNELERTYSTHLWWMRFHGRTDFEPIPSVPQMPDEVFQGGSVFFVAPFDAKGITGVRLRHFDPREEDSFTVFLPALKRTRVLSASDSQDPMCAGCDVTWDEWRAFWQKMDTEESAYELVGETVMLFQADTGMVGQPFTFDDCKVKSFDVELRPVWILKQTDKTKRYQYGHRRVFVDMENYYAQLMEAYDQKGQLWRTWDDSRYIEPWTGLHTWRNGLVFDHINKHGTFVLTTPLPPKEAGTATKADFFNIETLKTYQ